MGYTITVEMLEDGRHQVTVKWTNGTTYTTTCIGTLDQVRWHAEKCIIPDMLLRHPELRGETV